MLKNIVCIIFFSVLFNESLIFCEVSIKTNTSGYVLVCNGESLFLQYEGDKDNTPYENETDYAITATYGNYMFTFIKDENSTKDKPKNYKEENYNETITNALIKEINTVSLKNHIFYIRVMLLLFSFFFMFYIRRYIYNQNDSLSLLLSSANLVFIIALICIIHIPIMLFSISFSFIGHITFDMLKGGFTLKMIIISGSEEITKLQAASLFYSLIISLYIAKGAILSKIYITFCIYFQLFFT